MKKVLLIVFILILVLVSAVAVFALTFNVDRYRPLIQKKFQEALKLPVQIKKISLGWNGGIALDVDGLTVFKSERSPESLVHLKKASVLVNLEPLFRREIQVSSIVLESPEVDFVQTLEKEVPPAPGPEASAPSGASGGTPAAAMSFLVDEIKINNGSIRYSDPQAKSPVDISIRNLDASIRNISLAGPLDFDGKASIFSNAQNTSLQGKLRVRGAGAIDIENLLIRTDLQSMDTAQILKSLPSLQSVGLAQGLAGNTQVSIKKIEIAGGTVRKLEGQANLNGGRFKTADMPLFFENATLDADFSLNHAAIQKLTGNLGSGNLSASGLVQNLQAQPQSQAEFSLTGLSMMELIPPSSERAPYMEGTAFLGARVTALGAKDFEIRQTLNGGAQLSLQDGVLRNMNVLREIIDKLSMIPGVSKSIQSRLPQGYNEKLQARDTVFEPVEIPVTINQGFYFFDKALIRSESFAIVASGKGDTLGNLQGEASFIIEPALSQALMAGVNELQYLADSKGQLQVPVILQGVNGKFSATPNVNYVVSKLATAKTQEVLGNLLAKKTGVNNQTASQQNSAYGQNPYGQQQPQQQTTGGLLGQLLSSALESRSSNGGSSQQ